MMWCVQAQRKRRTTGSPPIRSGTKSSRRVSARRASADTGMSNSNSNPPAETIDVVDGGSSSPGWFRWTRQLQPLTCLLVCRCGGSGGSDLWGLRMCCGRFDQQWLCTGNVAHTLIHTHTVIHCHTHTHSLSTSPVYVLLLLLQLLDEGKCWLWSKTLVEAELNVGSDVTVLLQVLRAVASPQQRVMWSAVMKTTVQLRPWRLM